MGLLLSVISYQQLSPDLQARFSLEGTSAVVGRSQASDWFLPDNEKVLSSTHAELTLVMDKYYITDVSTNGVFVNQAEKPLGKGNRHELQHGDQLSLGEYAIDVSIEKASASAARSEVAMASPFEATPNSQMPFSETAIERDSISNKPSMADPFLTGSEMNDSMVLESNFIPDDWDWDTDNNASSNAISNSRTKVKETVTSGEVLPKVTVAKVAVPEVAVTKVAVSETSVPKETPLPEENVDSKHVISARVGTTTNVKAVVQPQAEYDSLAAFLKGLGIEQPQPMSDQDWWFDLGQSIRTMNEELMSSLRERAAFKNNFRVNHTIFQMKENNPFKFSGSVDDLFRNLYLRSNDSFMTTNKAITEAFTDLRKHEQSMRAGLEGAVIGVLQQLAPENMADDHAEQSFFDKFKPAKKEQKMWRSFVELHEDISNEITVNRESILSDAFVKAYEDKQKQG
jgi:type VI secretion system protein ImpI